MVDIRDEHATVRYLVETSFHAARLSSAPPLSAAEPMTWRGWRAWLVVDRQRPRTAGPGSRARRRDTANEKHRAAGGLRKTSRKLSHDRHVAMAVGRTASLTVSDAVMII